MALHPRLLHAVLRNKAGIAYLAPELQLLLKNNRTEDDRHATEVVPARAPR